MRTDGVDVAMGRKPDARLVVHQVILDAAGLGLAPGFREVLQPFLLESSAVLDIGIVGIVAGDKGGTIGQDAVARVGVVRIDIALRSVFVDGERRQDRAVVAELRHPARERNG